MECPRRRTGPVTPLDRLLQSWRLRKAARFIQRGARVLDIGCSDGVLFRRLAAYGVHGVGVDPTLCESLDWTGVRLLRASVDDALPGLGVFDVITLLAVVEHLPEPVLQRLVQRCRDWLKPGGRIVLTVPSPWVDPILRVLIALRLVKGMEFEEHHGFDPNALPPLFHAAGFRLREHQRFQLGLNHVFVFE